MSFWAQAYSKACAQTSSIASGTSSRTAIYSHFRLRLTRLLFSSAQYLKPIGGQIFNPKSQVRINYSVTHDPIEYAILAVVVGIAALICGGVVLSDDILNRGKNRAREHCGEHGVKKLTIKRKHGFGWDKGAHVGCGEDYIIECNSPRDRLCCDRRPVVDDPLIPEGQLFPLHPLLSYTSLHLSYMLTEPLFGQSAPSSASRSVSLASQPYCR
jgi:hypothetical protein